MTETGFFHPKTLIIIATQILTTPQRLRVSFELSLLVKRDPECGRLGMEIALEMIRESGKFPLLSLDNLPQQAYQGRDGFHLNDMRSERPYRETLI